MSLAAWDSVKCHELGALPRPEGERVGVRGFVTLDRPEPLTPALSLREREQAEPAASVSIITKVRVTQPVTEPAEDPSPGFGPVSKLFGVAVLSPAEIVKQLEKRP